MTTHWTHQTAGANANGVAWVGCVVPTGSSPTLVGGYANVSSESTDTGGSDVSTWFPVIGSYPYYNSTTDTQYVNVGFAAPPGVQIRCHVWAIVPD